VDKESSLFFKKNRSEIMTNSSKQNLVGIILALFLNTLFPVGLSGQNSNQQEEKSILIKLIPEDTKIEIDGILLEDFWSTVEPVSDFVMRVPIEGNEPTERTEVKIAYDNENIYMAVTLYDNDPSGIKAFQKSPDADIDLEDSFTWFFDTYYDKRNAYIFAITPLGVKADGLVSTGQGNSVNLNWDGIWHLSTRITDLGWVAEIKIPFRTLNFDPNNDTWGVNFRRVIRRKNEEAYWTGYKLNQEIDRPQDGGKLIGIRNVSQGLGLEAVPYMSVKNNKVAGQESDYDFDAGIDINYNLTSNVKASITVNTDFAETEVDDRQINLTRFPLQFPEKRDFFLEGAGIYSFAPRSFIEPYFSRRIGLIGGRPIPVNYGARILGRVGNLDMALLNVGTRKQGELESENFTVARLKQNIGSESTVGFIYTRRSTKNGEDLPEPLQTRHTYGADLELNTSSFLTNKILQFQAFFVFHNSDSPLDDSSTLLDRSSRGFRVNFPNRPWFGHCSYREFGTEYDPAVGFNRRNGFRRIDPRIGFRPNFPKSNVIRDITWSVRYENLWDLDFSLLTQNLSLQVIELKFESGEEFEINLIRNYERLESDFDILRDGSIIIPLGEYANWIFDFEASTAPFRNVVGNFEYRNGGFWSGNREIIELGLTLRLIPGLNIGSSYVRTNVDLEEGEFTTNLIRLQTDYDITPRVSISSTVQYDDLSKVLGMNHRFRWVIKPGSDLFFVYNHNWLREAGEYQLIDRSNILKANYTHRF
jgi:hypothetical protein